MGDRFNENLKEARLSAGFSQKYVAEVIGVAKSTYSLYESGGREPDVEKIKKLAKLFGVSGDMLLGISENTASTLSMRLKNSGYSDDEIKEITNFANYVKQKRC